MEREEKRKILTLAMLTNFFSNTITNINTNYSGVYAAEKLNLKPHQLGTASSISTIATQLTQPIWGYLSDLKGIRKYFTAAGYLAAGLAIAIIYKLQNYIQYIIAVSVTWIFWNGAYTCWQALIGDVTSRSGRGRFIGALGFAANLGGMVSSILAGFIIDIYGYGALFNLCIVFAIASAIPTLAIKEEKRRKIKTENIPLRNVITGKYRLYLAVSMGWWGIMSIAWPLFSITQVKVFHFTKTEIGLLALSGSIVSTFTSPIWGRAADKIGRKPLLTISPIFASIWTFAYAFSQNYMQVLILTMIGNIGGTALMTVSNIYLLDTIIYRERRATLISIYNILTGAAEAIGQYIGGQLGSIIGLRETMTIAGILRLTYTIPILILPETVKKGRKINFILQVHRPRHR